jgi:tRNA(Ile)-lysidine synthase
MARKHGAAGVFVAHHVDDQAETILANLCRGAGLRGLGGMRAETALADGLLLLRPMLLVRRGEIDECVAGLGLAFREDSSNSSLRHRRNRVRHTALPLLNEVFERDVAPIIARTGVQAARDDDCLNTLAAAFPMAERLPITPELQRLHPAVLSRVLTQWLKSRLGLPGIDFEVVESAMSMLRPGGPAKINLASGRHLRRRAKQLFVTPG